MTTELLTPVFFDNLMMSMYNGYIPTAARPRVRGQVVHLYGPAFPGWFKTNRFLLLVKRIIDEMFYCNSAPVPVAALLRLLLEFEDDPGFVV